MREQTLERTGRLHTPEELIPWRCATMVEGFSLYWMPVRSFPVPDGQRVWLLRFIEALARRLEARSALRCETFLQMSTIYPDLREQFQEHAMEAVPLIGLSWASGMPEVASPENDADALRKGKKAFNFGDYTASYCYWFLNKTPRWCDMYFGKGGITLLFMPPDPGTKTPSYPIPSFIREHPHFKTSNLDGQLSAFFSMKDKFAAASKQIFGPSLEKVPGSKGTFYALPRFQSRDFRKTDPATVSRWFELFDVYLAESPADTGIVLASKTSLESDLVAILHHLRGRGEKYPEP